MTWIYGWPFPDAFAYEYAVSRNLVPANTGPDDLNPYTNAARDILRRSGLGSTYIPQRICWVNNELECVFALKIDYHSRTKKRAHRKLRASHLPPKDCAFRLGELLGYKGSPRWYRHSDGSWNPKDGQVWIGSDEESDTEEEEEEEDEGEGSETQREDEGESTEVEAAEDDASKTLGRAKAGAEDRRTYASIGIQVEDAPSRSQVVCAKCTGECDMSRLQAS
ncbi:hypothetical protein B0H21DRAFT_37216 [Amylocystis lapponica]|nr:hypothetical protein B0H21DRAFT_37216 [Amylocystis lapponica]